MPLPRQDPGAGSWTALELKRRLDAHEPLVVLDVREDSERAFSTIAVPGTAVDLHVPMGQVATRLGEIRDAARDAQVVVFCHLGVRSSIVAQWLVSQGIARVHNLEGGIDAWSERIDPEVRRY